MWSVGLKARAVFRYSLQFQVEPELRERVPLFPWRAAPRRTKQKASKPTSVSAWRLRFEGGLKEEKRKRKNKLQNWQPHTAAFISAKAPGGGSLPSWNKRIRAGFFFFFCLPLRRRRTGVVCRAHSLRGGERNAF